jgi:hypothetical protein
VVAVVDQRHLCAQTFNVDITAEVENDQRQIRSGSWGDDQTGSPTLNEDLKLSKKLARWLRQLKDRKMKKEGV